MSLGHRCMPKKWWVVLFLVSIVPRSSPAGEPLASEAEIATVMARCEPSAMTEMQAALPQPERRYHPKPSPPPASIFDQAHSLSLMAEERFFRWYDFSQILQAKRLQLGISSEEYQQFVQKNHNKFSSNKLLFWYPHRENGFTHPLQYRLGEAFQFIVHAVSEWGKGPYLMANPDEIVKLALSTSLLDQHNLSTYSSSGFILEVHPDLLYAAGPRNLARNGEAPSTMNWAHGIMEPREVLAQAEGRMNEVVIAGSEAGGRAVKIIGLFMQARTNGKPWPVFTKTRLEALARLCSERNLPLVALPVSRF